VVRSRHILIVAKIRIIRLSLILRLNLETLIFNACLLACRWWSRGGDGHPDGRDVPGRDWHPGSRAVVAGWFAVGVSVRVRPDSRHSGNVRRR